MNSKVEDIADLAKQGKLPGDIKAAAEPVSPKAKQDTEDARRLKTVRGLLQESLRDALKPQSQRRIMTTGHWKLDKDTGGFSSEGVWVFGADTSWGKSASLLMVADENIRRGFRVLIVSFEDKPVIYGKRLLQRRSGFGDRSKRVSSYRLKYGSLTRDERERITDVANGGEDVPVYFDAIQKSVEWTCKQVRKIVQLEGIDLVAFDYLQAADHEKPQKDRRLQLNYITRVMTDTIKTMDKAGIIYSQITPPDDERKVPGKYSLRDSKDVSNGAEIIAIGFEPVVDIKDKAGNVLAGAGEKVIRMAKNKLGPGKKDWLYTMDWDDDHGCFDVVPDPDAKHDAEADAATAPMHWGDGP